MCRGREGLPLPLETCSWVFHTCPEGELLELRTQENGDQMDNSVASPPNVGLLLSSHSEPLAKSGHSQFMWSLCQLGKGSLPPDAFISFSQKTVLINTKTVHVLQCEP